MWYVARKRQTLINPIISPLACLMCHAVNFPHSTKTAVRKNVVAPHKAPRPAHQRFNHVRVLHACIDKQQKRQQQQQQQGERMVVVGGCTKRCN